MAALTIRILDAGGREAIERLAAQVARREHAKIMHDDRPPLAFKRFVGNVEGAVEETVKLGEAILYQYNRLDEVTQYALECLFDLSPVRSGAYRSAHTLFVNGEAVSDLKHYRDGDDLAILNPLPYARKIEMGRMTMVVSGTDRVYQQARAKVARRFGNHAQVDFTFRALISGRGVIQERAGVFRWRNPVLNRAPTGAFEKTLRPAQHNQSNVRVPALIIRPAGSNPIRSTGRRRNG